MSDNFLTYINTDDRKHMNEFVVIVNGKVVSHGDDAGKLLHEVCLKYPQATPLIAKIPPEDILL